MKKSQLYGQVFIYVLTIVLVSFILVYGYNTIQNFRQRAEQVACLKFQNDLRNSIEIIISDFGSVKRKDLQLCSGYPQVCFVETFKQLDNKGNLKANININNVDPILTNSIASGSDRNVFLRGGNSFYAGNISVENDVLCINSKNGQISIGLEGKGNHVLIRQWA